jgi:hypothetical protein
MIPKLPHENCYWVVPGRVIAGEYPGGHNPPLASQNVRRHLEAGVRFFIDLTEEGELVPYDDILATEASRLGIENFEYQRFGIPDINIPDSDELTASALDAIDRGSRELPVVYIHCRGGIGRTGTIVGCWFRRHLGLTGDEALDKVAELWEGVEKSARCPSSPETIPQCDYVRKWKEPAR